MSCSNESNRIKSSLVVIYAWVSFHLTKFLFDFNNVKKYSHSNAPSSGKSVQWTAFSLNDLPNKALILLRFNRWASSGWWGPHSFLKQATASWVLTSIAIHDPCPDDIASQMFMNSVEKAYLYNSRNSCTYPSYRLKSYMAETSKPSSMTMSKIEPKFSRAWGLTTKQAEFVNKAVVGLSF